VNLLPDEAQSEIASAAARFLAKELPLSCLASHDPCAPDRVLWSKMGALGWFALGIGEHDGGAGYGLAEDALLFRELGRVIAPGPFLATALAARAAAAAGERKLLEGVASGALLVGLAEPWRDGEATLGASVSGRFRCVDATSADLLLATGAEGVAILEARGVEFFESVDPTTSVGLAALDNARVLVHVPESEAPIAATGAVLVAAMLAGICEATRDQSVGHALGREQFGRPIGSFQAVKHRCADMAVRAEAIGSLTTYTALTLQGGRDEAVRLVPLTKALASEYAIANAADNIQNHGGMGFTEQCPAHLFLKRAHLLATVLGTPAQLWTASSRRARRAED
jgi:alkylation response protein AidB-like acyl-CoA dehydrogenase